MWLIVEVLEDMEEGEDMVEELVKEQLFLLKDPHVHVTSVNVKRVKLIIVKVEAMEKEGEAMGKVIAMEEWRESIAIVITASARMDME